MTNVNNRWVILKNGEPYAVNLSQKEAEIMIDRLKNTFEDESFDLFWDEYFEFENE